MPKEDRNSDPGLLLCLGAGANQLPLIRAAHSEGFQVVAVDRNPQAPGLSYSEFYINASLLHARKIDSALKQQNLKISAISTRACGAAVTTGAILARRLRLNGNHPGVIRSFNNKRKLKERLIKAGINAPRIYAWRTATERAELLEAPLPLLVRPAVSHGKQGLRLLKSSEELEQFLHKNPVDRGNILIEELVTGSEVTTLGQLFEGRYYPAFLSDKITSQTDPLYAELLHRYPSHHSCEVEDAVHSQVARIVELTGLENGPLVAEFLITRENEIKLVEIVPEAGGEFLAEHGVSSGTDMDYFKSLVGIACGVAPPFRPAARERRQRSVIIRYLPPRSGRLVSVRFPDELLTHPGLLFSRQLKEAGCRLSLQKGNLDRPAVFALSGTLDEQQQLEATANRFAEESIIEYQ